MPHNTTDHRLRLHTVSPAAYWICWVFVYLNVHLSLFFSIHPSSVNKIVDTWILSYQMWSIAFAVIAILLAAGLVLNLWRMVIVTMMIGFTIKLLWAVALVFMIPDYGYMRLAASIGMWFSIAAIQAIVVIYLYPREEAARNRDGIL